MTKAEGEGVTNVVGLRGLGEPEQVSNHRADLLFARPAVSGERALDHGGGVVDDFQASLGAHEQDDAAGSPPA